MKYTIKQRFLSMSCQYDIFDERGANVFSAKTLKVQLLSNISLLDTKGMVLYNMSSKLGHIGSWFDVSDGMNNFCFAIDETFSLSRWFNRAKIVKGQIPMKIRSGPMHLYAYITDEKGKFDKKAPVVTIERELWKIADTFDVIVDETKIRPEVGLIIGIWYDYQLSNAAILSASGN